MAARTWTDNVARVAQNEKLTWLRLGKHIGADTRVGTGDKQRHWPLACAQIFEKLLSCSMNILLEVENAFNDACHGNLFSTTKVHGTELGAKSKLIA
jgi:hypothetical protein